MTARSNAWTNARWNGLSGAVGFGLLFVALLLPGPPPKADDSARRLTALLVDHRAAFVRGTVMAGLGVVALLWFIAVLASALRAAHPDNDLPAAGVLVGGLAAVLLMLVGMLLFTGVAFRAAGMGEPVVVRAAVDTGNALVESGKYGFAVLILAVCAAGEGRALVSAGMRRAGQLVAVLLVASSVPPYFAEHAVGQFGGPIDVLGGLPAFAWLVALSLVLARPTAIAQTAPPGMPAFQAEG
jgi:hypothetical protein